MPTKDELTEEVEALKRSNAALKGQITKLQEASPSEGLEDAVRVLLKAIDDKGLTNQIGNRKEVATVRNLLA